LARVIDLLRRFDGATILQLTEAMEFKGRRVLSPTCHVANYQRSMIVTAPTAEECSRTRA
jgi:hypothetical protein